MLSSFFLRIHTFNFEALGTKDQVLPFELAEKAGYIHTEAPMKPGSDRSGYAKILYIPLEASEHRTIYPSERPQLAWSWKGVSDGVGVG